MKEYHKKLYEGIKKSRNKILSVKELLENNKIKFHNTLKPMIDKYKEIWKRDIVEIFLMYNNTKTVFTKVEIEASLGKYKTSLNRIKMIY